MRSRKHYQAALLLASVALATSCESGDVDVTQAALGTDAGPDASDPSSVCPAGTNVIVGTSGNDVLTGTSGADCILGLGGDDEIDGRQGNDHLFGGDGDDVIHGAQGRDRIVGGAGADVLFGDQQDDIIEGGEGDDRIFGGVGRDEIHGGPGDDFIDGENGKDDVWGDDGCDQIDGVNGKDNVYGGPGDDAILGGHAPEHLEGGDGNDRISTSGPPPTSTVDGGSGTDACGGAHCELPAPSECDVDADCPTGELCLEVGLCAPSTWCGCGSSDATCDANDDDCDGSLDEDYASSGTTCGLGACAATGSTSCAAGTETDSCEPGTPAPSDATCDARDDDCDGTDDEDYVPMSTSCGVGACAANGATSCDDGVEADSCEPGTPAADDATCDAVDDDCDGADDEDYVPMSTSCGVGACAASGTTTCVDGSIEDSCAPGTGAPSDPTCDAVDDDCDGADDEDYVSVATTCGVGACAAVGATSCVAGSVGDSCAPGTPAADDATCDGVDDDCDGSVDEDYAPVATSCGVGACGATGATSCVAGSVVDSCTPGAPAASDATCDAIDDDCDGADDEDYVASATACGVGACGATGATSCVAGSVVDSCTPGTPAADDATCDAIDDDCDGAEDEDYVSAATSCGVGACGAAGATSCVAGAVVDSCTPGSPAPNDATCDAIDDDCDGAEDEDYAPLATSCGVGACGATGATSCVAGSVVDSCAPGTPAADDATCDAIDDDCDGTEDEDYLPSATSCGVGACGATGATSCVAGSVVDSCMPGTPAADDATCDAMDDDCDGAEDEDYAPLATSCGVGACGATGATSCVAGSVVDSCTPSTPAADDATCDAIDDDCDGTEDEDYVSAATSCGVGACGATGATSCVAGSVVDSCSPGTPAANDATCDAIDDDCDGTDDEDYLSTTTSCGVGACGAAGTTSCVAGTELDSCTPGTPAPKDSTCDAIDDDCDGTEDEDFPPFPTECGVGVCSAVGHLSCVGGTVSDSCTPGTPAADDATCDAVDDDCDGTDDEDYAPVSTTCGVGACFASGATACVAGTIVNECSPGAPAPSDPTCDSVDDDCDGSEDEDFAPSATACGVGACAATGATSCVAGTELDSCTPGTPAPSDATCDAVDDDCDGSDDEDYAPVATSCGVGACAASGATACVSGAVVDGCAPGTPAPNDATCDAIDDDCDGTDDEDYLSLPTACGVGACAAMGATSCVSGAVADSCAPGAPAPSDATCDAIDDDCDGTEDEDYLSLPTSCGIGECGASGATACVSGAVLDSCAPGAPTSDANCDALDQDCDGTSDEDYVSTSTSCGVGACAASGALVCASGAVVDTCAPGAPAPSDAVCDAIDEDCDGASDEDFAPYCAGDASVACVGGIESSTSCADGDACNGDEGCTSGACVPGTPPTLDDGNPCTVDSCDPVTGVAHDPAAAGTSCDDADVCNGEDLCDGAGACVPGTPPTLDDGNPCTVDTCDPLTGVAHDPTAAGTSCDDGDPCNGLETCDGAGMCIPGTRPLEGPCVPAPPMAAIFVDDRREVAMQTVGGAVVSYDGGGGLNAPFMNDLGLNWEPTPDPDGMADVVIDLAGTTPQVVSEIRLRGAPAPFGLRHFEVWTSSTTAAPGDFTRALSAELPADEYEHSFPFDAKGARFVRIRVLERWDGLAGAGRFLWATIWTRPRDGGAVSLYEGGVPVTASAGNGQYATDFDPATLWDTFGSGAPVAGQTVTVDLPGTGYHTIDRVRLWGGTNFAQVRNFEVLVSSTSDDPSAFSVVASALLPRPGAPRNFWYFFPPTRARYVQLRTVDNHGFGSAVGVGGFTVFTSHEGGLTVPFEDRSLAGGEPIIAWRWEFGDGTTSDEQHPTHTYAAPGTYVIRLRVVDAYGLTSFDEFVYSAYGPPVADFVTTPDPVAQGQALVATDTSYSYGAPLVSIGLAATSVSGDVLLTGDGGRTTRAPGGAVFWNAHQAGTLRVTVDATDATLLTDTVVRDVPVENVSPTIDVGADQTVVWGQPWTPVSPATISDVNTLRPDALSCSYDFGDGPVLPAPAGGCRPTNFYLAHTWDVPGTYPVRAIVSDGFDTTEDHFTVEVTRRDAAISLSPVPGAAAGGTLDVTAQLIDAYEPTASMAGRTVQLRLGTQTVSGVTGADGRVTLPLDFPAGVPSSVIASFAGDAYYYPAHGEASYPETLRPSYPGNCGTDYWIAIPNPCTDGGTCATGFAGIEAEYRHHLFFSAEASTAVRVEMPGHALTSSVLVDSTGVAMLEVPLVPGRGAVRTTSTVVNDTIHITSERIVCVHEFSFIRQGSEGFLALPTNSLGTDYVIGSASGFLASGFVRLVSQFVVVGTQNGTDVTITPSYAVVGGPAVTSGTVGPAGVPFTVRLDEGQVVQIRAATNVPPGPGDTNYDLTGTTISATAPVSVIGGHQCAYVPPGFPACNTLVEQVPPVSALGTEYLLTPFAQRTSGYIARVVATENGTDVSFDGAVVATLARGEFHEVDVTTQTAHVIDTSEPALVYQMAKSLTTESSPTPTGDPVMLIVVPSEQFDNGALVSTIPNRTYTYFNGEISVEEEWSYEHFLNIVVPTAEAGGVRVDGAPVAVPFSTIGASPWSYAQVPATDGPHRVTHLSPAVPVGVSVYGWAEADGYAYPARLRLTDLAGGCTPTPTVPGDGVDNDCDGRWDEEEANGLDDDGDGLADEDLIFETGPAVNLAPFAYDRVDSVLEDGSKVLVMTGFDPNGDALTYEVLGPTMFGGLVGTGATRTYTPIPDYTGPDSFTYRVCDIHAACSDPATFAITVRPANDLPTIAMDALYTAYENERFELALVGSDPEGGALAWELVAGWSGQAVESDLARFSWTPDERFTDLIVPVTVAAIDPDGGRVEYTFGIRVLPRPDAPYITSRPVRAATFNLVYYYDVEAADPDLSPVYTPVLEYFLNVAPAGMGIDINTGEITWVPTLADAGPHDVEVVVRDDTGLLSEPQRFVLTVAGDSTPPTVTITHTPDPVLPGDVVTFTVTATDDDMAAVEGLTVGGAPVTLDPSGVGTWTATAPGRVDAEASAVDPTGNRGFATDQVRVLDASDTDAPFVELTAPEANDILTYLHEAVGTVRDPNLYRWWLEMRPADRGGYRTMLTGTNAIESATIGTLDVTQLRNGIWILRLRAEDLNGESASVEIPVRVQGGAKLGVVHLEFTDLVVPDFGIPIAVNRIYDSRDADQVGDFGHGWTLDIRQGSIQHNYVVGEGIAVYTNTGDPVPCQRYEDQLGHYAEVRLSDDEWYTFRPVVTDVGVLSGGCSGNVAYELVDGVRPGAELRIIGNPNVRARAIEVATFGSFAQESDLISTEDDTLFDPQDFELLLPDGRRFGLNAERGIVWIEDRNGNSLSIVEPGPFGTPGGLAHSSGRNVVFVRDAEGRIIQIMDAAGRSVGYAYDADGNLVTFTDVLGRDTRFEYNAPGHPHHLTDIIDWRGVRVAAIDYQPDGRMRELCDADGVCAQQEYDLAAQTLLRFTGLPNPTRYAYDERGNVVRIEQTIGGLGINQFFTYGGAPWDNLVERFDADGITRYQYAADSRDLTAEIPPTTGSEDPDLFRTDHSYHYIFDGTRYLQVHDGTTLPSGGTYHYETDTRGNQTHVRDDAGNAVFTRTYNPDGSIATLTDRFGTVAYEYGPSGRPTRVTGADGTITDLDYDISGNVTELRRGGVTQRFRYDAGGRRLFSDFGNGVTVRYEYDNGDDWTAIEGPTFGRVERRLSSSGRLLSWTEPNGDTYRQTFDAAGQLRTRTDELGNVTTYTYDEAGRLLSTFDAARGATTSYVRDPLGRVLSQTNPDGEVTSFTYDPRGNVATTTDERMHVTTLTTLPASTAVTDPLSNTTTQSQSTYGLPTSAAYPGGASTSSTFRGETSLDQSSSFPLTQVDESSRTRSFSYDPRSVLTGATDLGGNPWTYGHAEILGGDVSWDVQSGDVQLVAGGARSPVSRYGSTDPSRDGPRPPELDAWTDRLETVTSPLGEETQWTFGPGGEIARVDYPNGGALTRTFGADLRVATETRPFGTTLTFAYDAAGRVVSRTGDDGSSQSFVYGAGDRLASITDATGTTTYHHDAVGRMSGLDYPSQLGFEQDWDVMDRVDAVRVHGDPAVDPRVFESTYTYDEAGNLDSVTDPFGRTTTYTYDALNRLETETRPNGVTSTHTYDPRGRVSSIVHADGGGAVIASVAYVRAPSGEPTRITREDGSYVLVDYDAALRVERERYFDAADVLEEELAYTYDADGNRTSRSQQLGGGPPVVETYVYGPGSELLRVEVGGVPTQEFTYDAGGRCTRIVRDGRDLRLTYDADDHVTAIEDVGAGETTRYGFDAEGRRTSRQVFAGAVLMSAMAFATAPGLASGLDSPHLVDDGAGVAETGYVYEGEHALARYDAGSSEPVYYLRDAMGSVIGVVDHLGASGRVHYDGFGNERSGGALAALPSGGGPLFQGMWAEEQGLYYVRARLYDPDTGRFLSRDPIDGSLEPETWTSYALSNANAFTRRDPTGLYTLTEGEFVLLGLAILAAFATASYAVVRSQDNSGSLGSGAWSIRNQLELVAVINILQMLNIVLAHDGDGGDDHMGDNTQQNKIFNDAVREIERIIRRTLRPGERRRLHDRITGRGLGYHDIVAEGLELFQGTREPWDREERRRRRRR